MVVGVHSRYLGLPFAEALRSLNVKRAWVVNGDEGLDEISPEGTTHVSQLLLSSDVYLLKSTLRQIWDLQNGQITSRVISPATFGLPSRELSSVAGGLPHQNAQLIRDLMDGKLDPETSPIENFVVMNAAGLLVVSGKAKDEKEGVRLAREAIKDGRALAALDGYREQAQKALQEEEEMDKANGL
jgi:anthranilate phosphoribosyltransferase